VGKVNPRPIAEVIGALVESQLLDFGLGGAIREVYAICSFAVHGQTPSGAQVHFVENVVPGLLKAAACNSLKMQFANDQASRSFWMKRSSSSIMIMNLIARVTLLYHKPKNTRILD
jgi:hypothetical protein